MDATSTEGLLTLYREQAEGTSSPNPTIANRSQRSMHAAYKKLRETPEGRAGIAVLMRHASPQVRCWAAAHCLGWEIAEAKRTLESLRESRGPCSFDAEMTLEAFRNGCLSFDY